jgi:hypothetical protein
MRHLGDPCTHSCHQHSVTALGFNLVRDQGGQGLAYLHSSALTTTWDLRGATPLITPNSSYPAYLPGILIGVLTSARPWCHTWTGELLSVSAWLHVSLLSGYTVKQTARDAHSAITTALATSSHSHSQTVNFMNSILPHLPMAHCCHVSFCAAWLQKCAHWAGPSYSSWCLPPQLSPNGVTGSRCSDWPLLSGHAATLRPSDHVCPQWGAVCM